MTPRQLMRFRRTAVVTDLLAVAAECSSDEQAERRAMS
jgi:hypothetical protein